jgi:transposase
MSTPDCARGRTAQERAFTKMGHPYLRRLLVLGAQAVLRQVARRPDDADEWLGRLLREKPRKVAAVALANQTARIVWALLARVRRTELPHEHVSRAGG